MSFMDSYKRLEKLCGEIMDDDRRVSAYIDEMISISEGRYIVDGWDDDLKQLKHYRWVRNKIAHDPDCTEEKMCTRSDTRWINGFYSRIIDQSDPLSLYRKAKKTRSSSSKNKNGKPANKKYGKRKKKRVNAGIAVTVTALLLIAAAVIYAKIFM